MTAQSERLADDQDIVDVVTLSEDGKTSEIKDTAKKPAPKGDDYDHEGDDDERLADGGDVDTGTDEEIEAKKAARRQARRDRKQHRRNRESEKDAVIANLSREVETLKGHIGGVSTQVTNQNMALVDQRIAEATQARQLADEAMQAAINAKDGKAFGDAQRTRDVALTALHQLNDYKTRATHAIEQSRQAQPQAVDQRMLTYAQQFKQDNPWFVMDTNTTDEDSKSVFRLDASVKNAGYKADTPEYWEELQRRVDNKFPNRLAAAEDDVNERQNQRDGQHQQERTNSQRRGPAMGGGRSERQLGDRDVAIPRAVREAAEAAGYWKDPAQRADFIRRWKDSTKKYAEKR